jgi:hypothetical protein
LQAVGGGKNDMWWIRAFPVLFVIFLNGVGNAGEADVLKAEARNTGENTFQFHVTVKHQDEGWNHYADKWDVVAPDGTILGTRILYHPHDDEQPFTRSLSGVKIPEGIRKVTIRAHDSVHEYGGRTFVAVLPPENR